MLYTYNMMYFISRAAKPVALALIISLGIATAPLPVRSAPVVVVIVVVATAMGAVAIYDYNSCGINIIWGCENAGGGTFGGGITTEPTPGTTTTGGGGNQTSKGTTTTPTLEQSFSNGSNNSAPVACLSATANGCGMFGNGFLNAAGVCSATPPSDSTCPAPAGTFSANPNKVRKGNSTNLFWNVQNATACAITGGGLSIQGLGISGSVPTNPIANQTIFYLSCFNGPDGGPVKSIEATVNITPSFQEI